MRLSYERVVPRSLAQALKRVQGEAIVAIMREFEREGIAVLSGAAGVGVARLVDG